MKRPAPPAPGDAAVLRTRAERALKTRVDPPRAGKAPYDREANASRLQHELDVHQVELEIQNAELQKTRAELEAALARYTELYDLAPIGYFTFDGTGRILAANVMGASLLGIPRERLAGTLFEAFLSAESRPQFALLLARALPGARTESCEVTLAPECRSERVLRVEATASPTGAEYRAALLDVTGLKAAEAEVRRANEGLEAAVRVRTVELQAANSDLEAFVYSVSHDLRAPLRAISGFAQLLAEDCAAELPESGEDSLRRIRAGAAKMGTLIDDLLRLSRVGSSDLEEAAVDLAVPCREILAELASGSPGRLVETIVPERLVVRGDARLLRAMLENLLGNAWKFTSPTPRARIEVGSRIGTGGQVDFFVRDNGVGFDMSETARLFRPFRRLRPESEFPGTGIGLAIADRIARRHGGSIRAEGRKDLGATFHVLLPAARGGPV